MPLGRSRPALGLCETMAPLLFRDEAERTLPTLHRAFTSADFAAASFFPTTFGTRQPGAIANVRDAGGAAL